MRLTSFACKKISTYINDKSKKEVDMDKKENTTELKSEVDREKLLGMSEIALWLDTYDDIFSDFDPRPFTQRALSVDFLDEIKRASREKVSGQIELKFLVPRNQRSFENDLQVKKRLKEHFKRHHDELEKEGKKTFSKAVIFIALGFALLGFAAFIDNMNKEGFFYSLLVIFLEPAGWFTFWFSLEQLFDRFKEKKPEIEFYEKMSKAEISFMSY
jgi:hypothetical protein